MSLSFSLPLLLSSSFPFLFLTHFYPFYLSMLFLFCLFVVLTLTSLLLISFFPSFHYFLPLSLHVYLHLSHAVSPATFPPPSPTLTPPTFTDPTFFSSRNPSPLLPFSIVYIDYVINLPPTVSFPSQSEDRHAHATSYEVIH